MTERFDFTLILTLLIAFGVESQSIYPLQLLH